ncbi:MAG TPA: 1-deoxy-D-xylulose-5-phosphate reductoisomerase [Rickettsiales bacterium]|nr:1-deoxy-D-xylulose-5-phosphate reductoisomerase [Rickettsiales bacterium]
MKKKIAIFGSTGSIGKNTIEVIKNDPQKFEIISLVAKQDIKKLAEQANEFKPKYIGIADEKQYKELCSLIKYKDIKIVAGEKEIAEIAKIKCDLFIAAIVGFAGLKPVLNAIKSGSNVALANKESLVCAGEFLMKEAAKNKVKILPVDSEHNAIFQIFENENLDIIDDIILTASGGPFFNSKKDFSKIKVSEALKHPNWSMGAKISVDSATMMNKGLEMIEAFHLFPIAKNQIDILVHPQSIIHGIVNYQDGSSLAMLSLPDMKVPLSYCLASPRRMAIKHKKLNLAKLQKLEFFTTDEKKFPAIKLCKEAMQADGNAPTILNAANEIAVEKFLQEKISFDQITKIVAKTLDRIVQKKLESIEDVFENDIIAREIANKIK